MCESPITLLKIVYTLAAGPLNVEALGFSLSSPALLTMIICVYLHTLYIKQLDQIYWRRGWLRVG
jgi:hypothetical protein